MDEIVFLARFWGGFLFLSALLLILRPEALRENLALAQERRWQVIFGWLSLMLGLGTVAMFETVPSGWRLIPLLLGEVALLKGIVLIGAPHLSHRLVGWSSRRLNWMPAWLFGSSLLGLFLLWKGFFGG